MIRRWFVEMDPLSRAVRPEMVWSFDELMAAASRAAKVVVTGERGIFSLTARKTPHVMVGACFNYRGTRPLLC
jgi:hypothetical protein